MKRKDGYFTIKFALSEKWGWVKVQHLGSVIKITDEDRSLLASLAKMEFMRKYRGI